MAISLTYNRITYSLPEEVASSGPLSKWLSHKDLSHIDRGDEMLKNPSTDQAGDHQLGKIELFQAVMAEYQSTYQGAVRVAVESNNPAQSKKWTEKARHLNELAGMIRELGYEPAFHIDYLREEFRDYHFRLAHLIREIPVKERKDFNYFLKLNKKVSPSCKEGGLGLKYPSDISQDFSTLRQEEVIQACVQSNSSQWGACTNSALKSAMVAFAALAVYSGTPLEFFWFSISNTPLDLGSEDRNSGGYMGHAFIALKSKTSGTLTIDPSEISFNYRDQFPNAYSYTPNIWRAFLSSYYNSQCNKLMKDEKKTDANYACHKAYELSPNSIFSLNSLATFLDIEGKSTEAIPLLLKAQNIEPDNRVILRNLITVYERAKQFDQVKKGFQKLFRLENNAPSVFYEYGLFLAKIKEKDAAIEALQNAVALDPSMTKAFFKLGLLYSGKREFAKSERAFQAYVKENPNDTIVWSFLGDSLFFQGKFTEAEVAYKKVLESPTLPQAHREEAQAQLKKIEKNKRSFWKKFLSFDWWPFW